MTGMSTDLKIPVSTTGEIPGRTIDGYVGPAFGLIVRSSGAARNVAGSFKSLKRGEVEEFTATLSEARMTALERLVDNAVAQGGDAVIGLRYDSSDVGSNQGMGEIVAYGTAVKLAS